MNALLLAVTAALNAYSAWVRWQFETELDRIEDEIDKCAEIVSAGGTDSINAQLRIQRLGKRKQQKLTSFRPI